DERIVIAVAELASPPIEGFFLATGHAWSFHGCSGWCSCCGSTHPTNPAASPCLMTPSRRLAIWARCFSMRRMVSSISAISVMSASARWAPAAFEVVGDAGSWPHPARQPFDCQPPDIGRHGSPDLRAPPFAGCFLDVFGREFHQVFNPVLNLPLSGHWG